ncbi:FAD-dependent oxidoreductase [Actinomadura logoneensis]|uniref:FAD-dependent oxidoreductase n=1 Tax=Actinomadura logoneensis TaxID=2293572 RepID=A0A372JEC1_9ACTN|nr:FAD-dependent oxidoreductase [Actinomadura logoneensis]RFU38357.1 FAD-dependent oxidoreductase [Actinomadura logoneensis]
MDETVVVVGGGYGGAAVAKALDAHADVVLVEPRDAFVHSAGSLRALVRPEWAPNMFFRYDRLLSRGRVVRARAASVDAAGVTLESGERIDAGHVVLASGSGYPYPAKTRTDVAAEALAQLRETHRELAGAARVLIAGAGPVGLELAGEIKAVWPDKQVTIVDPAERIVPAFAPEMRADLHRQLDERGIGLRLGTRLSAEPPVEPGRARTFTVDGITADIWFRAYGVDVRTSHLGPDLAAARTPAGRVRVTPHLNVEGFPNVYALGDVTDLDEAKMAGYAMRHAEVVAANIAARVRGEEPTETYTPSPIPSVLLPLGPDGGVGQFPTPDGPLVVSAETVAEYKGRDLFIDRFVELFGTEPLTEAEAASGAVPAAEAASEAVSAGRR